MTNDRSISKHIESHKYLAGTVATHKSDVNNVQSGSMFSLLASTRRATKPTVIALDSWTQFSLAHTTSLLTAILDTPPAMNDDVYCINCLSKNHGTLQCTLVSEDNPRVLTGFRGFHVVQLPTPTDRTGERSCRKVLWTKKRPYRGSTSHKTMVSTWALENNSCPSSQLVRARNLNNEARLDASNNQNRDKMLLILRSEMSATTQQRADEPEKLTNEEYGMSTPPSSNLFHRMSFLNPKVNQVVECARTNYVTYTHAGVRLHKIRQSNAW